MPPATPPEPAPAGATLFDTALGRCGVSWVGTRLVGVQLPGDDDAGTLRRLTGADPRLCGVGDGHALAPPEIAAAIEGIRRLLGGDAVDLNVVDVDLDGAGAFERAVYAVTRSIPPGATLTYGEVARRVGQPGAARAVGRALGANPTPIVIPCHRVVGAGARLVGFSAAGGTATKRRLLLIEGAPVVPPSLFD